MINNSSKLLLNINHKKDGLFEISALKCDLTFSSFCQIITTKAPKRIKNKPNCRYKNYK